MRVRGQGESEAKGQRGGAGGRAFKRDKVAGDIGGGKGKGEGGLGLVVLGGCGYGWGGSVLGL